MRRRCHLCRRSAKARGLCDACYNRVRYYGALAVVGRYQRWRKNGTRCRVCAGRHHARGLCKRHYWAAVKGGQVWVERRTAC